VCRGKNIKYLSGLCAGPMENGGGGAKKKKSAARPKGQRKRTGHWVEQMNWNPIRKKGEIAQAKRNGHVEKRLGSKKGKKGGVQMVLQISDGPW